MPANEDVYKVIGQETERPPQQQAASTGVELKYLVPLIYAPMLPLIRISLRSRPKLRDRMFGGAVAAALIHGGYIMSSLYNKESGSRNPWQ